MGFKIPACNTWSSLINFRALWVSFSQCIMGHSRNYASLNVDQGNFYITGTCLKRLKAINPSCYPLAIPTKHHIHTQGGRKCAITFTSSHRRGKLVLPKCKRKIHSSSCQKLKARVDVATMRQTINQRTEIWRRKGRGGISDLANDTRYEKTGQERLNEFENASRIELADV